MKRRGRPAGLTINPDAVADALKDLGDKSQAWLARGAGLSPSHLAEMLAGSKGVTEEVAERIATVLDKRVGTLFPQRVAFRISVREFTASSVSAA